MKRILLVTLAFVLIAPAIFAQGEDVRQIRLDTISGVPEPVHVGVDAMKFIGTNFITREDSSLMRYVTMVTQRDVNFYADFDLITVDTFYLSTYEIKELDLLGWKRLGAEFVVRLEAEFPGENLRGYWRLYDVNTQRQVAKGNFEYKRIFWREMAHDIANEIVRTLTGEPGIFRTKIAYIKKLGDTKEVFMSDYDGANEVQLTNTGTINLSPMFAPDGQFVYFTSYMKGDPQLFKVSVKTKKIEQITSYPGIAVAPAVSPDGNKIACVLSKDGNSEIYVIDLNGRIIKRLTNNRSIDSAPTWSPDGRMIAFSSDRTGAPQLYIMDSDGIHTRRLTYRGGYNDSPIWSDRGDRITFVSRTKYGRFDLASIDTSGTDYRVMTEVGHNENPHFSPDGKQIIFSSNRLSESDLYTMDLSGRNQRRLTRSGNCSNPTWGPLR
jgi:TolB protein